MKILYHHRTLSKDGQDVHIEEMIGAFRRRGHEVVVVAPGAPAGDPGKTEGSGIGWLKRLMPRAVYELLELGYTLVAYRRLRRAYLRHKPALLYERYNLFMLAGRMLNARYSVPFLLEVNAPLVHERAKFDGLALEGLAAWSERATWRAADYVLPVTDQLAEFVRRAEVPDTRIRVIPNGINRARFADGASGAEARRELGLDGKVVLGFTGYIRAWHGLSRVVDLLADMPERTNLHFLVLGDGPDREDIEAHADARGVLEQVTFLGVVPRDRVGGYVAAFDIALQPRVTDYASPLKLFEYMALGCAIVGPDQSNIREVLTDRENSLLFAPDDDESFRAAVLALCRDEALRRRLGRAAARTIDDRNLTWDGNAERIEGLVEEVARRGADRDRAKP